MAFHIIAIALYHLSGEQHVFTGDGAFDEGKFDCQWGGLKCESEIFDGLDGGPVCAESCCYTWTCGVSESVDGCDVVCGEIVEGCKFMMSQEFSRGTQSKVVQTKCR